MLTLVLQNAKEAHEHVEPGLLWKCEQALVKESLYLELVGEGMDLGRGPADRPNTHKCDSFSSQRQNPSSIMFREVSSFSSGQ